MSKVSICGNGWTNLVFEGRNKEYGAYQLRKEDSVNTITAFFFGLLFIISLFGIGFLLSSFSSKTVVAEPDPFYPPIHVTKFENPIREEPKKEILPLKKEKTEKVITKKDLINPIITKSTEPVDDVKSNEEQKTSKSPLIGSPTGTATTIPIGTNGTAVVGAKKNDDPVNTNALDKLPEFPGGIAKFYSYVGNNFEKPEIDGEQTISVYVSFVIEENGTMSNIKVVRDPGYGLGNEAIRVLKSLKTKWSPGMIAGQAVRTFYDLPIKVTLQ
jgi:protein TonB